MKAIGIDFGTTNSVAAVLNGANAEVLAIGEPSSEWAAMGFDKVLPSVVALDDNRHMAFGWQAKELRTDKKFAAIKRLFREEETVTAGGEEFFVEEIAAALFGHIKQRVLSQGIDFDSAVITIPANSRGLARHRTKVCAGMAGIPPIALINEPTAAAMAYAQRHDIDQQTVLVFDFGGGTLDVTVLAVHDGMFFEQGSSGIARLGGVDFDHAILRHISEIFPDSSGWSRSDKDRLLLEIEKAKINLSGASDETIITDDSTVGTFRLSLPQFNELTRPLVERSGEAIRRTLSDLRMTPDGVDQVLLVGGTSNVPAVRQYVKELLGKDPATGIDPMTAVGEGAAIAAAIMSGQLVDNDFFLSTEHAMGTVVADSVAQQLRFATIIPKNQKLPAKESQTFVPMVDFQESVNVTVIEGDERLPLSHPDNLVLGEFPVPLDPPRPAAEVQIELSYTYDVDGILLIDVLDGHSDRKLVETIKIAGQGAIGGREAVEMASRVRATVEDGSAVSGSSVPVSPLPPESAALVATARSKVIPFVDDDDAATIKGLVEALENAELESQATAHDRLEKALAPFSYLL